MKTFFKTFLCMLVIVSIVACSAKKHITTEIQVIRDTVYLPDTVYHFRYDSVLKYNSSLASDKEELLDSLNRLNEELFVANYKLERIKEYNKIAGNGNNIKYLRGWINRVFND